MRETAVMVEAKQVPEVPTTPREALLLLILLKQGVQNLAEDIGLTRQSIYLWLDHGVPIERAIQLEQKYHVVTRAQLRPDIYD